jgi:hypothetical protein
MAVTVHQLCPLFVWRFQAGGHCDGATLAATALVCIAHAVQALDRTVTCSSKAGGQSEGASFGGRSDSVAESAVASSSWNAVLRAKPWLCNACHMAAVATSAHNSCGGCPGQPWGMMPCRSLVCMPPTSSCCQHIHTQQRKKLQHAVTVVTCSCPKSLNCGQHTGMPPLRHTRQCHETPFPHAALSNGCQVPVLLT